MSNEKFDPDYIPDYQDIDNDTDTNNSSSSIEEILSTSILDNINEDKLLVPPTGHGQFPKINEIREAFNNTKSDSNNIVSSESEEFSNNTGSLLTQKSIRRISENANSDESEKSKSNNNEQITSKHKEVELYIDQVLADHRFNYSRGCKPILPDDPDVKSTVITIRSGGLINNPEVIKLPEPLERKFPTKYATHYTHRINSGYIRFTSLEVLNVIKWKFQEVNVDEDQALINNGIENFGRSNPTEYHLAIYAALLARKKNYTAKQIAEVIGAKTYRVEGLLNIINNLPEKLLEIFRVSPTNEVVRDLSRIAKIVREDKEKTHQAMIDEYSRLLNERALLTEPKKKIDNVRTRDPNAVNKHYQKIINVRSQQQSAQQWYDSLNDCHRVVTEDMRDYADAILRHLHTNKSKNPLE